MKYMFLIYEVERNQPRSPEDINRIEREHTTVIRDAENQSILLGFECLKSTETATTLRVENGVRSIFDGPFAETKEQLTGYYLLECKDLDDAIEWAWRIPNLCADNQGCVEIRPVNDLATIDAD